MSKTNLTREQLYQLVWQKPATELSKELGISDVAIGKMCKRFDIPKPNAGYWAKVAAGKPVIKVALPKAKSWFFDHCYVNGGSNYYYSYPKLAYWKPKDDEEPPPPLPDPPQFDETLDEFTDRMRKAVGTIKFSQSLNKPHRTIQRWMQLDEERAQEYRGWGWRKPRFQHPEGKVVLEALNRLFYAWDELGAKIRINGPKAQDLSVELNDKHFWVSLYDVPANDKSAKGRPRTKGSFELKWGYPDSYRQDNSGPDMAFDKLDKAALAEIVLEMIVSAEKSVRSAAEGQYKSMVRHIDEELEKREQRRLAAIERHKAEVRKLMQDRLNWTDEALVAIGKADKLRSLIDAFDVKYESSGRSIAGYEKWRRWAEHQAETMDPRFRSAEHIEQWIAKFGLAE